MGLIAKIEHHLHRMRGLRLVDKLAKKSRRTQASNAHRIGGSAGATGLVVGAGPASQLSAPAITSVTMFSGANTPAKTGGAACD